MIVNRLMVFKKCNRREYEFLTIFHLGSSVAGPVIPRHPRWEETVRAGLVNSILSEEKALTNHRRSRERVETAGSRISFLLSSPLGKKGDVFHPPRRRGASSSPTSYARQPRRTEPQQEKEDTSHAPRKNASRPHAQSAARIPPALRPMRTAPPPQP
jgi:hypothetical protein